MTPAEIALLLTAAGGGATVQAGIAAVRAWLGGARSRESDQNAAARAEVDRARESERESRSRADAMEHRYDRMTAERNRWREYAHVLRAWAMAHVPPQDAAMPPIPPELPPARPTDPADGTAPTP